MKWKIARTYNGKTTMVSAICYFSKRCRFCQAFLEELVKTPYVNEVRMVCVDPSPSRPPLPAWLKSVPSMEVRGEQKPRVGPNEVNNWLFERRLSQGKKVEDRKNAFEERNAPLKMPTYSPDLAPRASPAPRQNTAMPPAISASTPATSKQGPPSSSDTMDGPAAWHGAEMSGGHWSDSYSFLEEGSMNIVRNFEMLQDPTAMMQSGGGGNSSAAKGPAQPRSAKEEKLLSEFEAYSKAREMDFAPKKRIG